MIVPQLRKELYRVLDEILANLAQDIGLRPAAEPHHESTGHATLLTG